MKLTVLTDNNTLIDKYYLGEPGVSYLLEENGSKVLFDTGYSDVFIRNAQKMGIDLLELDYIVISHGHLDHTGGLEPLLRLFTEAGLEGRQYKRPVLLAHPLAFKRKYQQGAGEIGALVSEDRLATCMEIRHSRDPMWISEQLVFLGQIPRVFDFEAKETIGCIIEDDHSSPDSILDDTAMVFKTVSGLVIITGCSHSGICNIIRYAKEVCKEERIVDIVGGFHLLRPSTERLEGTMDHLEKTKPQRVHACHCIDLMSKIALSHACNIEEVGVGLEIQY
ncbi:MBL fold metallo-hydrolase [Methanolobus halotolerans]|uniref:MBL fold metallo-hydrolase n=1 Tax=Methanolobus halotolerans TaxID=2052935 RepID=A0A4E0Q988_9EURY|nr:MBL fold metallo-hydrolase [Methanolobus halotolerans]TGC11544.1 MBL fold metallo-hydrolase [Methanolobus halotolerans]